MSGGILTHVDWLVDTQKTIATACGLPIGLWKLQHEDDPAVLSAWAIHFRRHYLSDDDLLVMVEDTGMSHSEYLLAMKFPDASSKLGPSIRSGDFAEILVADYFEYVRGYWCPREFRYDRKTVQDESTKGCDIIGFKVKHVDKHNPDDEMFVFEVKAGLTGKPVNRLQDAVNDSIKDRLREAQSLNALKQRFVDRRAMADARKVQRFQKEADRPFKRFNGAAAVLSDETFDEVLLSETTAINHPNRVNLELIAISGKSLMKLVHALYERAANEA